MRPSAPSAFLVNLSLSQVIMRRSFALSFWRKGVTPHSISYSRMPTDHQSTACSRIRGSLAQSLGKGSLGPAVWSNSADMHQVHAALLRRHEPSL